jgi:hypothetical protein
MLDNDKLTVNSQVKTENLPTVDKVENGLPDQPYWNMKHYTFLRIYRETLDEHESAKIAGLDTKGLRKALDDPKIRNAMEDAKNDFVEALSLTATKGANKFLQVFKKIEKRFDEGDSKVAGPLSNMAATFLKATGQLSEKEDKTQSQVVINISLDHTSSKIKNVGGNEDIQYLINT